MNLELNEEDVEFLIMAIGPHLFNKDREKHAQDLIERLESLSDEIDGSILRTIEDNGTYMKIAYIASELKKLDRYKNEKTVGFRARVRRRCIVMELKRIYLGEEFARNEYWGLEDFKIPLDSWELQALRVIREKGYPLTFGELLEGLVPGGDNELKSVLFVALGKMAERGKLIKKVEDPNHPARMLYFLKPWVSPAEVREFYLKKRLKISDE